MNVTIQISLKHYYLFIFLCTILEARMLMSSIMKLLILFKDSPLSTTHMKNKKILKAYLQVLSKVFRNDIFIFKRSIKQNKLKSEWNELSDK